jgi:hypothetical protein
LPNLLIGGDEDTARGTDGDGSRCRYFNLVRDDPLLSDPGERILSLVGDH